MRDALEQLLFQRYPGFYVGRHMPLTENFMAYGFTHGDGWFAIVDVLSGLATQVMDRTGKRIIASQAKEKLGGLRFYMRRANEIHRQRESPGRTLQLQGERAVRASRRAADRRRPLLHPGSRRAR